MQENILDIRDHITNSIQEFKSTLDHMKRVRDDKNSNKEAKIKAKKDLKRTEKLFNKNLDGFTKKPEFNSTVASQYC